jgi:N-acetylglucosamine-6-phosphate deacetylase
VIVRGRTVAGDAVAVSIEAGLIAAIAPVADAPPGLPRLLPGLVDLQVNGYGGFDANGPGVTPGEIVGMAGALAADGTTTFVPTVITASTRNIRRSLGAIRLACENEAVAAAIPFVHVEGPWLSPVDGARGAHDLGQIRRPSLDEFDAWQDAAGGMIGMVTLSPHWEETPKAVAGLVERGVRVSLGHTHASPEQIRAAVDAGATFSTHLGNGIQATLPRHPNAIWTQLADDRLTAGLIADGHHLPVDTLRVMLRAKGRRAFVVSDAVALAGSAPVRYAQPVGGEVELFANGRLCVAETDYLAGAGVCLFAGLRTLLGMGSGWEAAVDLVATRPGIIAGRGGVLAIGEPANLVLVNDHKQDPVLLGVWQGGQERSLSLAKRP